ncbi:MAG: hypothetical protein NW226_09500 [Microscillaceae bacterium]|nr:hypothetical protein [Microscillaceae bacterium]
MPNTSGNAYALTTLCPLKHKGENQESPILYTRKVLQELPNCTDLQDSPMSKVPNTYLARFFILDDTVFRGYPFHLDHLQSKYLVFSVEFHGDLETYLKEMYRAVSKEIHTIWKYGFGFEEVKHEHSFVSYIKKCQVETTFFFNGSTDESLEEQLKSLYVKQEFSKFVFEHQGASPEDLLAAYKEFDQRVQPHILAFPTWKPGVDKLEEIVKTSN